MKQNNFESHFSKVKLPVICDMTVVPFPLLCTSR